jgi:hypothetical protein
MKSVVWLMGCVLAVGVPAGVGCAHNDSSVARPLSARRLLVLEGEAKRFMAQKLESPARIDPALEELEALRLSYLDVLQGADGRDRDLALLRIAELHLDLSARIRRIPYPAGASAADKARFDDQLSQQALPLEAVGLGVLAQLTDGADDATSRYVRRARLYQLLAQGAPLDAQAVRWLESELVNPSFAAPRSLLEAGRVGQRAAR